MSKTRLKHNKDTRMFNQSILLAQVIIRLHQKIILLHLTILSMILWQKIDTMLSLTHPKAIRVNQLTLEKEYM